MEENRDMSFIFDYAFCGGEIGFNRMIQYLSENAEEEKWTFDDTKPNSILKKYIIGTFSQCFKQNKILVSEDGNFSCFNTGLLTQMAMTLLDYSKKITVKMFNLGY